MTELKQKRCPDYTGSKVWRVTYQGRTINIVAPTWQEALVTAGAAWGIRWQDAAYHQEAKAEYIGKVQDVLLQKGGGAT